MGDGIPIPDPALSWDVGRSIIWFIVGFVAGGITGYFGNWLWYRFGPIKNTPHFTITGEKGNVSFSGLMTDENKEAIIKSLRASQPKPSPCQTKPTDKKMIIQASDPEISSSSAIIEA